MSKFIAKRMVVDLGVGLWDPNTEKMDEVCPTLTYKGCDCCQSTVKATRFNVSAAIKQHQIFIGQLETLLKTL